MTDQSPHNADTGRKHWLDNPKNVDRVFWSIIVLSAVLFLCDALYHKHPQFGIEKVFGFYGLYGFIICVGLIFAAKALRTWLMRDEDFYDEKDGS